MADSHGKICSKCKSNNVAYATVSYCKTCLNDYRKTRPKRTMTGGLTVKEYQAQWHKTNSLKRRERGLKDEYGISLAEYETIFIAQEGKCAICKSGDSKGRSKWLHVDHDHNTKQIRALLCAGCNRGIGCFNENITLMQNAIAYLVLYSGVLV